MNAKNPDVREMVKLYLKEHGFDGLCNEECGCDLEDFAPCGFEYSSDCQAGYKHICDKEHCDHECEEPRNFCMFLNKQESSETSPVIDKDALLKTCAEALAQIVPGHYPAYSDFPKSPQYESCKSALDALKEAGVLE